MEYFFNCLPLSRPQSSYQLASSQIIWDPAVCCLHTCSRTPGESPLTGQVGNTTSLWRPASTGSSILALCLGFPPPTNHNYFHTFSSLLTQTLLLPLTSHFTEKTEFTSWKPLRLSMQPDLSVSTPTFSSSLRTQQRTFASDLKSGHPLML